MMNNYDRLTRCYNPHNNYLDYMPEKFDEHDEIPAGNATNIRGNMGEYEHNADYGLGKYIPNEEIEVPIQPDDIPQKSGTLNAEKPSIQKSLEKSYSENKSLWIIIIIVALILFLK